MKIEPGVLAVICGDACDENQGHIVTVKEFHPELSDRFGKPWWKVQCPTPLACSDGTFKTILYAPESCLRPISGPSAVRKVRLWDELPREVTV